MQVGGLHFGEDPLEFWHGGDKSIIIILLSYNYNSKINEIHLHIFSVVLTYSFFFPLLGF